MSKEFLTRQQAHIKLGGNPGSLLSPHDFINKTEAQELGGDSALLSKYPGNDFPVDDDISSGSLIKYFMKMDAASGGINMYNCIKTEIGISSLTGEPVCKFLAPDSVMDFGFTDEGSGLWVPYSAVIIEYDTKDCQGDCDVFSFLDIDSISGANMYSFNDRATETTINMHKLGLTYPPEIVEGLELNYTGEYDKEVAYLALISDEHLSIFGYGGYGQAGTVEAFASYIKNDILEAGSLGDSLSGASTLYDMSVEPYDEWRRDNFYLGDSRFNYSEETIVYPSDYSRNRAGLAVHGVYYTKPLK